MTSKKNESVKYSFAKVAGVVKKFITVLQVDLDRLEQHSVNIKKVMTISQHRVVLLYLYMCHVIRIAS